MDKERKRTRDWIIGSTLTDFNDVIKEAKITPEQEQYVRMKFEKHHSITMIAIILNVSEREVVREIQKAYNNINKVLDKISL